ncbi:flavin reductase [Mycetocola reblochoni]|uniref:Flavin reductase n=1 Tax=Mycetocola reblochoni TaxID=331618 RepID=A0A3L6ZP17_9MICO|nr:flavin reductase [Mycetocola reblochoni]
MGDAFKEAFRHHPAGVAIITATTPDGPVGLTASSVSSVSVDPPALSFSVTRATGSAGGILGADSYVVHLLHSGNVDVARSFAVSGAERFTAAQGWSGLDTGEPHLAGAAAALRCRTMHRYSVGGSTIVVAEVLEVLDGHDAAPHRPLVYRNREFHGLDGERTRLD